MTTTADQREPGPRPADETPQPPAGPGWDAFRTAPAFTLTDWEHD